MIESSCCVSVPRLAEDESSVCTVLQVAAVPCRPLHPGCRQLQEPAVGGTGDPADCLQCLDTDTGGSDSTLQHTSHNTMEG